MHQRTLTYQADGLEMASQLLFKPAEGPRAGLLVFPEAFGLGENAIRNAERLAATGYAALACDLHGHGRFIDNLPKALAPGSMAERCTALPVRMRPDATCRIRSVTALRLQPDRGHRMLALFASALSQPADIAFEAVA